jgi:DNA-binding response OmpR family regulator
LSVLIVEDETLVALDAEMQLTDAGARVMGNARSIEEAKQYIASTSFDVAILDVNLNGQLSYPLADLLACRGIAFVFASGYSEFDGLPERWRATPVVNKPYNGGELAAAIAQARHRSSSA